MVRATRLAAMALVAAALMVAPATARDAAPMKIDSGHSSVGFMVKHSDANSVFGIFAGPVGTVELGDTSGSLNLAVQAASITTANAKRDEHLKGADFFAVSQFPAITFKSTSVKKLDDKTWEVAGDLTLRGITKPLTIKLEKSGEGAGRDKKAVVGYTASFAIKRSEFGMTYGIPLVADEVNLAVSLQAAAQ